MSLDDPLTAHKKVLSASGALRLDAAHGGPVHDELDDLLRQSVVDQVSILVQKDSPFQSVQDVIEAATQNPGSVIAGGTGTASLRATDSSRRAPCR